MANNEYEAHHWTDKELITAPKLNRIEEQLEYLTDNVFSMAEGNTLKKPFYYKFQYEGTSGQTNWHETPLLYVYGNTDRWLTSIISHNDNNSLYFREYSNSEKYENYSLPAPEASLTNDKFYNILTDKKTGKVTHHDFVNGSDEAQSLSSGVYGYYGPWTVEENGTYTLVATATFTYNAVGMRQLGITGSTEQANFNRYALIRVAAAQTNGDSSNTPATTLQLTYSANLTAGQNVYVSLRQDSKTALNVTYVGIQSLRIL